MVISKYALDHLKYNEERTDVTWETCTLRKWLNEDFYNTAFTDSEKNMIITQSIKNTDNSKYNTEAGKNTEDKVFLLSIDEACSKKYGFSKYVSGSDINRRCALTEYAKAKGAVMGEYETSDGLNAGYYYLRSPGMGNSYAAYVSSKGCVLNGGGYVNKYAAVRPVIVIDTDE